MFRPLVFAMLLASGSTTALASCPSGQSEMSVEGVNGVFCVADSPICIADISTGACPAIQTGLPYGSYCGLVATGVYGCKTLDADSIKTYRPPGSAPVMAPMSVVDETPTTMPAAPATTPVPVSPPVPTATDGSQCGDGQYEMSVEGVQGIFCLTEGPICMADVTTGTCPGPQFGLPNGAYCGVVGSGVYGCKVNNAGVATTAPVTATTAPSAAPLPAPAALTNAPAIVGASSSSTCPNGGTPMSVEGIVPIFCVQEPACVADRSTGRCPSGQDGLPWGSYCDIITRTGQYGCKPYNGTDIPNNAVYPAVRNCAGSGKGNMPVSVVDAGTFCAAHPVCAGSQFGNCPAVQDGLVRDATCAQVRTGVYGCVLSA